MYRRTHGETLNQFGWKKWASKVVEDLASAELELNGLGRDMKDLQQVEHRLDSLQKGFVQLLVFLNVEEITEPSRTYFRKRR